jgi:hypothetical protein
MKLTIDLLDLLSLTVNPVPFLTKPPKIHADIRKMLNTKIGKSGKSHSRMKMVFGEKRNGNLIVF